MTVASEQPAPMDPILSGTRPQLAAGMRPRPRLDYLDGVRGCAALYVVLYHAMIGGKDLLGTSAAGHGGGRGPAWLQIATAPLQYGYYAVGVFIVLSGYCLMLPVIQSKQKSIGSVPEFFKRRAWRILPPYYIAIVITLLLNLLIPDISQGTWSVTKPVFALSSLITHLLLIHNFRLDWALRINSPMWSVATEWQIYILFALLLLPIWRRLGSLATIIIASLIGLIPHFISGQRFDQISGQYLGLFAMGMAAAHFAPIQLRRPVRTIWLLIGAVCTLAIVWIFSATLVWGSSKWLVDLLCVGPITASMLIVCTDDHKLSPENGNALLRLFRSRAVLTLGSFSYSLYLIHWPCLEVVSLWCRSLHTSAAMKFTAMICVGPGLSLIVSYAFHLAFERPFLRYRASRAPFRPGVLAEGRDHGSVAALVAEPKTQREVTL